VLDMSASMQAKDGASDRAAAAGENRFSTAQRRARELVRGLGSEDLALIIGMDGRPAPACGLTADDRELLRAIDSLEPTDAPALLERALRLAADALRGQSRPTLVLIGDGSYDDTIWQRVVLSRPPGTPAPSSSALSEIDLTGIDLRFLSVGKSADNVGI